MATIPPRAQQFLDIVSGARPGPLQGQDRRDPLLLHLLIKVATVDGAVAPAERELFATLLPGRTPEGLDAFIADAAARPLDLEEIRTHFATETERLAVIRLVEHMVRADKTYARAEFTVLVDLKRAFDDAAR